MWAVGGVRVDQLALTGSGHAASSVADVFALPFLALFGVATVQVLRRPIWIIAGFGGWFFTVEGFARPAGGARPVNGLPAVVRIAEPAAGVVRGGPGGRGLGDRTGRCLRRAPTDPVVCTKIQEFEVELVLRVDLSNWSGFGFCGRRHFKRLVGTQNGLKPLVGRVVKGLPPIGFALAPS